MQKILFIAYYFPPMGSSGVQRSIKFVKYLRDYGIEPIVLTINPAVTRWPKDPTFLAEIPSGIKVYRTLTFDLNWLFKVLWGLRLHKVVNWLQLNYLIPDAEICWLPFAKARLKTILREHKIDLVYITGGPFSSMLLGPYVKQRYNLSYIVDFRDEWTNNHSRLDLPYSEAARMKDNSYEKSVLDHCSGVIYAHPKYMQDSFERKYPKLKEKPHIVITNGYDETDFQAGPVPTESNSNIFRIVYSGSFYNRRRPLILWQALKQLISMHAIDPAKIRVEIYGKNTPSFVMGKYADDETISGIVRFHSYLTHQESLSVIQNASVLLIFLAPGPNSLPELPGKMFECMRSGRPIIAIVPRQGAAAEIITRSGTGFAYDSDNIDEISRGISSLYNLWIANRLEIVPDVEYIRQFDRKSLTGKLANFIKSVVVADCRL